jgi:hypothetical protein
MNCTHESVKLEFDSKEKTSYATFVIVAENLNNISVTLCQKDWRDHKASTNNPDYKSVLVSKIGYGI